MESTLKCNNCRSCLAAHLYCSGVNYNYSVKSKPGIFSGVGYYWEGCDGKVAHIKVGRVVLCHRLHSAWMDLITNQCLESCMILSQSYLRGDKRRNNNNMFPFKADLLKDGLKQRSCGIKNLPLLTGDKTSSIGQFL